MNIQEYKEKIWKIGFIEYPTIITGKELSLQEIVDIDIADLDLKIHLAKVIMCRCFSPTCGIYWPDNPDWFISHFLNIFDKDLIKPWLTNTIKEAINMIMSADTFNKCIIGTTFMFGVIEFYAKYKLGYRPEEYDFFDNISHRSFRDMSIGDAFNKLKKTNTKIAGILNEIDKHNLTLLKKTGIAEERYVKGRIASRLSLSRNTMLHGENHSFYDVGEYLIMLYILFYLHDLKEITV